MIFTNLEKFISHFEGELCDAWEKYLYELKEPASHVNMLASSYDAFEEWVYENYFNGETYEMK